MNLKHNLCSLFVICFHIYHYLILTCKIIVFKTLLFMMDTCGILSCCLQCTALFSPTFVLQEDFSKFRVISYLNSDVFLVCFSIDDVKSLVHVKESWVPELRQHVPNTPFILVGTKQDVRFQEPDIQVWTWKLFLSLFWLILQIIQWDRKAKLNCACMDYFDYDNNHLP